MEELKTAGATEAEAIARLAQKPFVEEIEGVPHIFSPVADGWSHFDRETLLPTPQRHRGTIELHDHKSFIDTVKRYGSLSSCVIYVDADYDKGKLSACAVFNDHGDMPGWRDFRAVFAPRPTPEWTAWLGSNTAVMDQLKFAHFLESKVGDLVEGDKMPTGGDVMQFVLKLEDTRKVKYGSGVNLQNGMVQIEFIEDDAQGQKGKLDLFKQFQVGITPFYGADRYRLTAWLRYRIDRNTGAIAFHYELNRPDAILADATKAVVDAIRTEAGVPVVFGKP